MTKSRTPLACTLLLLIGVFGLSARECTAASGSGQSPEDAPRARKFHNRPSLLAA